MVVNITIGRESGLNEGVLALAVLMGVVLAAVLGCGCTSLWYVRVSRSTPMAKSSLTTIFGRE